MPSTRLLPLTLNQRTSLVCVDTVRAVLGCDADTVFARIESGELPYAFDVSTAGAAGRIREWRVWRVAVEEPTAARAVPPATAIAEIIGTERELLRGDEVRQLLLVSRPHLHALWRADQLTGFLAGGAIRLHRAGLEKFLLARLEAYA